MYEMKGTDGSKLSVEISNLITERYSVVKLTVNTAPAFCANAALSSVSDGATPHRLHPPTCVDAKIRHCHSLLISQRCISNHYYQKNCLV